MSTIFLHTGSNIGDREKNLAQARQRIATKIGTIISQSAIYETAAWGNTEQADFLNQAIGVNTDLSPQVLLTAVLDIENAMGRTRDAGQRWQPRVIDIDILLYGDEIIEEENLVIPHQELHKRNFVLVPLMEIASEVLHPVLRLPIEELYFQSTDESEVILLE